MIHPEHLRRVIVETLAAMGPRYASPAAVELLLLTAAHESKLGSFLWQHRDGQPKGPAVGLFQMEPGRWNDTADRMPRHLLHAVISACGALSEVARPQRMAWDLRYATAMARAAYWLVPRPLPAAHDIMGLDEYWWTEWCRGCRAPQGAAAAAYRRLVAKEEP